MIKIPNTNLYIGSIQDINNTNDNDWAFVHATQTIHYRYMNWNRKYNKPNKTHPNYIIYEKDNHLSLNWVDGAAYLYDWSGPKTFMSVLDFIDNWIKSRNVLVHCDEGMSRGPTIGLLYLAKRAKIIPNDSYDNAKMEFEKLYNSFHPSGIGDYVNNKWLEIS